MKAIILFHLPSDHAQRFVLIRAVFILIIPSTNIYIDSRRDRCYLGFKWRSEHPKTRIFSSFDFVSVCESTTTSGYTIFSRFIHGTSPEMHERIEDPSSSSFVVVPRTYMSVANGQFLMQQYAT